MKIAVTIYDPTNQAVIRHYFMDHNDEKQRRVLGEQCRNAFEGGQVVITGPAPKDPFILEA